MFTRKYVVRCCSALRDGRSVVAHKREDRTVLFRAAGLITYFPFVNFGGRQLVESDFARAGAAWAAAFAQVPSDVGVGAIDSGVFEFLVGGTDAVQFVDVED